MIEPQFAETVREVDAELVIKSAYVNPQSFSFKVFEKFKVNDSGSSKLKLKEVRAG